MSAREEMRAREAARLSLMLALGELQRKTGPDRRVTASAKIASGGDVELESGAELWTGVWNTAAPGEEPVWLVSGDGLQPDQPGASPAVLLQSGHDPGEGVQGEEGIAKEAYPATLAPLVELEESGEQIAWWIADEGVKAPVSHAGGGRAGGYAWGREGAFQFYTGHSEKVLPVRYDPTFHFGVFAGIGNPKPEHGPGLPGLQSIAQAPLLLPGLGEAGRRRINAEAGHAVTVRNRFVLSDTGGSGLKRDLSFLKTLQPDADICEELAGLYGEDAVFPGPAAVRLVGFRGNPTAFPAEEISGIRLFEDAGEAEFSIAPVVTEFQVSGGVVAEHGDAPNATSPESRLFFAHKVYFELWNPYTVPIRLGESDWPKELGYSDVRVEVRHLPSYRIVNDDHPEIAAVEGKLENISLVWSAMLAPKTLRPGMVYRATLPLDSKGDNASGLVQRQLGETIKGSRSDNYTGFFSMGEPVEVVLSGIDSEGNEKAFHSFSIAGYPDFQVDYHYTHSNRSTWFKRKLDASKEAAYGAHFASLEKPGYAFAFRYRMLDEQEQPGGLADLSNWMSQFDPRKNSWEADLATWDINAAWDRQPPLPYEFFTATGTWDPGLFDPSESFKATDFFHYETGHGSTGRRDRIARFFDLPSSEVVDVGIFRALQYDDFHANGVGTPWGGELNHLYDRYFFSTLPDPEIAVWDGESALANPRLRAYGPAPALENVHAAERLLVSNGFNLNATSELAWEKVLAGKTFPSSTYPLRFERSDFEWTVASGPVRNAHFSQPHAAVFNQEERAEDPRYVFISRDNTESYGEAFRIDHADWINDRQHPAFRQCVRELSDVEVEALAAAIVAELKAFYAERGRPPFRVAELLNAGVFQDAIDAVPSINARTNGEDAVPAYMPAYFSQATLMNALGPFAFVRSDTFRIRAYGRAPASPGGGPPAEAYCEARVQRVPDPHHRSALGRKYKILAFRWLDQNDL
ncbi:MAG: hypothetical protein ACLFUF_04980 [Opitutales bacterium]